MAHEVKFIFTFLDDGAERIILFQMCENYTQSKIQGPKISFIGTQPCSSTYVWLPLILCYGRVEYPEQIPYVPMAKIFSIWTFIEKVCQLLTVEERLTIFSPQ